MPDWAGPATRTSGINANFSWLSMVDSLMRRNSENMSTGQLLQRALQDWMALQGGASRGQGPNLGTTNHAFFRTTRKELLVFLDSSLNRPQAGESWDCTVATV